MALHKGTTAHVITPDGPSENFDITAGVPQGDTWVHYLFVVVIDYIIRNAVNEVGEDTGFAIKKSLSAVLLYRSETWALNKTP